MNSILETAFDRLTAYYGRRTRAAAADSFVALICAVLDEACDAPRAALVLENLNAASVGTVLSVAAELVLVCCATELKANPIASAPQADRKRQEPPLRRSMFDVRCSVFMKIISWFRPRSAPAAH